MLEQKLFFTRNGEYTLWEKIQTISSDKLEQLRDYAINELKIEPQEYNSSSTQSFIFNIYKYILKEEDKNNFDMLIDTYFNEDFTSGSDFNGTVYTTDVSFMNVEIVYNLLEKLEDWLSTLGIDGIKIYKYIRNEENCVDLRLSSIKKIDYKENTNDSVINTEVRIYVSLGLMVVTDYSDYTHQKSIKTALIQEIRSILLNTTEVLEPYTLSDMALRVLLKRSNKFGKKYRFEVDGYMSLDCNILDNISDDPLTMDGLKELYDKHNMSQIKVSMSANEEKYITIDGVKGKLISRSKIIEVQDINEFIILISEVVKYDYLHSNYIKQSKDRARRILIAPTTNKMSQVDSLYSVIHQLLNNLLGEKVDKDNISLSLNAFFYCLEKRIIIISEEINIKYKIDAGALLIINTLYEIETKTVNNIFNKIIDIAINKDPNMLITSLDAFIKQYGEEYVNTI